MAHYGNAEVKFGPVLLMQPMVYCQAHFLLNSTYSEPCFRPRYSLESARGWRLDWRVRAPQEKSRPAGEWRRCRLIRNLDQQLAEIRALQQADESFRRIFETHGNILPVFELAFANPAGRIAQEI